MKILNRMKQVVKAYTEGIYADTPANRKLGRVGMTYAQYYKKLKDDMEYQKNKKNINIPNKVYHKAPPIFRKNILKEGLKPKVGPSYSAHWEEEEEELTPVIFAYNKDKKEYNSTYDDDIYEIDTSKLDKESWDKDKDEYMYDTFGSIVYNKEIPKDAIKLIHRGTGNPID